MFGFVSVFPYTKTSIYAFQAQLVPQLIINYKLKVHQISYTTALSVSEIWIQSVSHMPFKAMIYKTYVIHLHLIKL